MTRDQLWQAYCARNPQFEGEGTVTMSKAGLRKLFEQTWDMAFKEGYDWRAGRPVGSNPLGDFFGRNPFGV